MIVKTPDDAIRLAKQLGFLLKCLADEIGIELSETEVTFSSDDTPVLVINAGVLCDSAKALQYGSLGDGDE